MGSKPIKLPSVSTTAWIFVVRPMACLSGALFQLHYSGCACEVVLSMLMMSVASCFTHWATVACHTPAFDQRLNRSTVLADPYSRGQSI